MPMLRTRNPVLECILTFFKKVRLDHKTRYRFKWKLHECSSIDDLYVAEPALLWVQPHDRAENAMETAKKAQPLGVPSLLFQAF